MIVGLILLGIIGGAAFGGATLISGASLGTALVVYAGTGVFFVLSAVAITGFRAAPRDRLPTEEMTGRHVIAPVSRMSQ